MGRRKKEKKLTINKLNMIKTYKRYSWVSFSKKLGVTPRFLRYYRKKQRKSSKIDKKINQLYASVFSKRVIFYIFKKTGSPFYGDVRVLRDSRSLRRFISKMKRRGLFEYFTRRWDLIRKKTIDRAEVLFTSFLQGEILDEVLQRLKFITIELESEGVL